jgi:diguanylate cyclase (GGDEF)-like protein/PAS domain S-box-containing protein
MFTLIESSGAQGDDSCRKAEENFRTLFNSVTDCMVILDRDGYIRNINRSGHERLGYTAEELLGRHISQMEPPELFAYKTPNILHAIEQKGHTIFESAHVRRDGSVMPVEVNCKLIELDGQEVFFSVIRDITERKQAEERIIHLAHYDALTNLPNRTLFYDRLEQAIAKAQRYQQKIAVLFLDLDGFKQVNDKFGHHVGDDLLKAVAERLNENARSMDTVARVGGDEFIFILNDVNHSDNAATVSRKIIESIARTFSIQGNICQISVSIGISVFPDDTTNADTLIKQADNAMYQAKNNGKNNYQFFNGMHDTSLKMATA